MSGNSVNDRTENSAATTLLVGVGGVAVAYAGASHVVPAEYSFMVILGAAIGIAVAFLAACYKVVQEANPEAGSR